MFWDNICLQLGGLDLGQEELGRETITSCFYAGIKCCDGSDAAVSQPAAPAMQFSTITGTTGAQPGEEFCWLGIFELQFHHHRHSAQVLLVGKS